MWSLTGILTHLVRYMPGSVERKWVRLLSWPVHAPCFLRQDVPYDSLLPRGPWIGSIRSRFTVSFVGSSPSVVPRSLSVHQSVISRDSSTRWSLLPFNNDRRSTLRSICVRRVLLSLS